MATAIRAAGGGRKPKQAKARSSITRVAPPSELLGDAAISLWKSQSKILINRGTFEPEDGPLLLAYCNAFHLMLEADKKIAIEGITEISGSGGAKKNPAIGVRNDCVAQIARLGSLMGLDPLSRTRMTGPAEPDSGNEFEEF